MASTPSLQPPAPLKISVVFVVVGLITSLGPNWRNFISHYIGPLDKRLKETYHPHLPVRIDVVYNHVHHALAETVYSVVENGTDCVIKGDSPDIAAFTSYSFVIKTIDDLQTNNPNQEFSFFLWHVVAGQHGSWDHLDWESVRSGLVNRHVKLSMVLFDHCPLFVQLFKAISPASSHITPWFPTSPCHLPAYLLSGFMPVGELGGVAPSQVPAMHHAPSVPAPSTSGVTPWDFPSQLSTHETEYSDGEWTAQYLSQHTGLDFYTQDPPIVPFFNGGLDLSGSAAVQNQPHPNLNNMSAPEARGLVPMECSVPSHNSGVEQPQPTPHDDAEKIASRNDFANANVRPMSPGLSNEMPMNDNGWNGTLNWNETRAHVRALIANATGDTKLSDLPNDLGIEPPDGPNLSSLDIQAWMRENKAPTVPLSYVDGTNHSDFDQLVQKIRARSYAIVRWNDRDRLLLAPFGSNLILCAAFPENGSPKRPTSQPPRPVRTITQPRRKGSKAHQKGSSQKKDEPQKKERKNSRQMSRSNPATSSKSSSGPCDGQYPDAAAQGTTTVHGSHGEPASYAPNPPMMYMTDSPNLNSEALEDFEMNGVNIGGCGNFFDSTP